jgi:hypothetical protein
MASINVTGSASTKKLKSFKRGRVFVKGSNSYVLAIHNTKDGKHLAALVNIGSGDSIHRLKNVAKAAIVTKAELATLNFKNSPATMLD